MNKILLCLGLCLGLTMALKGTETVTVLSPAGGEVFSQNDQLTVSVQLTGITSQRYLSLDFSSDGGVTWYHADTFYGQVSDGTYTKTVQLANIGNDNYKISKVSDGTPLRTSIEPSASTVVRASLWDFDLSWLGNNMMSFGVSQPYTVKPIALTLTEPLTGGYYKLTDVIHVRYTAPEFNPGMTDVYITPDNGVTWRKVNNEASRGVDWYWVLGPTKIGNVAIKVAADQSGTFKLVSPQDDTPWLTGLPVGSNYRMRVVLRGSSMFQESDLFTISNNPPPLVTNSQLINLSTRAVVAKDGNLNPGFVLKGSGAQKVLIRAVGPSLSQFKVTGTMPDPVLALYDGSNQRVALNDNWDAAGADVTALKAAFTAAGAFQLLDGGGDAVLLLDLQPGPYTLLITGADGTGGDVLAEVYQFN